MGYLLSKQERAKIRLALSDAFVDNEVDYESIARRTQNYDRAEVKNIFFSEVAPACHSNLESPLPSIWLCFDSESLETEIESDLKKRQESYFHRKKDELLILWLRYRYQYIWEAISKFYNP